ncbi:hypothetical protein GCM10010468_45750 [Actinocorallia longicatena]|uniref:Bacterial sugar transferase domain-containing protein n=2 Tax=Actinocorallia longicatena TaxID=111803 RepID=A0ABP6QE26_9ACTN
MAAILLCVVNFEAQLYGRRNYLTVRNTVTLLSRAALLAAASLVIAHEAKTGLLSPPAGPQIIGMLTLFATASVAGRVILDQHRSRITSGTPVVIVGAGPVADAVASALDARPEHGLAPIGRLRNLDPTQPGVDGLLGRTARGSATPSPILDVESAIIVLEEVTDAEAAEAVRVARALGIDVRVIPSPLAMSAISRSRVQHIGGFACVTLSPPASRGLSRAAKRAFDVLAASASMAAVWPLLLACAVAVRWEGGAGVLFRQTRVGQHGRPFVVLKFRTMQPADDHEAETRWSISGDGRIGPVGRFLRRTSLDELPQLWNVIRGDMSLVGPRPERPHFVAHFSEIIPGYDARHRVPVGITGWAQVNGMRGNTSIALRARFDNQYIDTWSFWSDIKIILMTVKEVFCRAEK